MVIMSCFSLFYLTACTSHKHEQTTETAGEHVHTHDIKLDNGKPWQANAETTNGIHAMQMLVNNFPDNADLSTSKVLKGELETEFNFIFEKCTMTGEAHEQLHAYLLPMKDMFARLDNADPEVCKGAVQEIKAHLSMYSTYFM